MPYAFSHVGIKLVACNKLKQKHHHFITKKILYFIVILVVYIQLDT